MNVKLILIQILFAIFFNRFDNTEGHGSITLPQGYVKYHGYNAVFKLYMDEKSWDEARSRCRSDGGDLAIIDTREKLEHVRKILASRGEFAFVGIHKPIGVQKWIRVDNGQVVPLSYPPWQDKSENYDFWRCGMATPSQGGIMKWNCEAPEKSLCEIPIDESTEIIKPALSIATLPEGYLVHPDQTRAYKLYIDEKTWDEARDRCMMDGGHLAIIHTYEKIRELRELIGEVRGSFIGIQKPVGAHKWIRIDNGFPVEFVPSPTGRRQVTDLNCAILRSDIDEVAQSNCKSRRKSVCEIPISQN